MNPNREELLFQLALTKPAAERAAWLDRECGDDKALRARLDARQWTAPPVFHWLHEVGRVPTDDMLRTFNCGLGMIVVAAKADAPRVARALTDAGEIVSEIGVLEAAPTDEADCVVDHAESLWRS